MTKIINAFEGQRLYELDTLRKMLSDDYLTDPDNIQTKFVLKQFLQNCTSLSDNERLELLNISYSIPSIITEKFSDYVGEPKTTLDVDLDDFVSSFIWGGIAIFNPTFVNQEFDVEYIAPHQYLLDDDGTERVYNIYQIVRADGTNYDAYFFERKWVKNVIYRKLYRIRSLQSSRNFAIEGEEVPLDTIYPTFGLKPEETIDGITKSPLVKVHNRKLQNIKYGSSEIRKVRSLISSIEIQALNIQDQFLKHLQSKLAMPKSAMATDKKTGKLLISNTEVIAMEAGDALPSYILNSNPLIDKSFTQMEDMLRQISVVSNLPVEFFGLKGQGGAESAESRKLRMASFIKKIETIRSKFEDGLTELNEIRKLWDNKNADETLTIQWPEIFPVATADLANELAVAQDAKLISNKKAVQRYQNITEADAEEEIKLIQQDHATIDASQLQN